MTTTEARALLQQPTITVEQFAEMFRLSKAGAYDAIAREEIAVTRIVRHPSILYSATRKPPRPSR